MAALAAAASPGQPDSAAASQVAASRVAASKVAGSGTAIGAGAAAAAPVVGAFGAGVAVGTYINNNTGISDTAMKGGEWVEGLTGSTTAGAIGAAGTAIVTSPYYAVVAAGGALEDAGSWIGGKVYDLFN